MTKRRRLDKSEITDPSAAFDLFHGSLEFDFDFFDSGVSRFNAIVLTEPILLSPGTIPRISRPPLWLAGIGFRMEADSLSLGKFKFFARIIGLDSPHSFLPDPCDPAIASDPAKQLEFIKLHTEFYSTKDSSTSRPKVGDTIVVELQQNAFSFNLYVGEYVTLLDSTGGNAAALQNCSGLASNFVNVPPGPPWTPPAGGGPAPPTGGGTSPAGRRGPGAGTVVVDTRISPSTWLPCIEDIRPLLDFIASGEGGYNSMNQGTRNNRIVGSTDDARSILGSNLTDMTISQIRAYQAKPRGDSRRLFAAGRYQIIPSTMPSAIANSGLKGNFVFNKENQDILGVALIFGKRPIMGNYILGLHENQHEAHLAFAQEWASVPDPRKEPPQSYHGSGNKSFHTNAEVSAVLAAARAVVSTKCGASPPVT